ncbi:MAG TPA: HIT domain-containing protein [Candidatus Paceibacterota bacterium]|nr:HIT domain-containing protein [Candidatus Paceibacterota bacterium]
MDDCIFCKIIAGQIPAEKIYEDDKVLAFIDKNPKVPGHTLLIPKEHSTWFEEMSDEVSDHVFRIAKKLAREMKKRPNIGYVQVGIVGKDVPHTHLHLLPQIGREKASAL